MKDDAFTLSKNELNYVFRLVALDLMEKKKKYESSKKVYENTNEFFQRLANKHNETLEEQIEQAEKKQ